MSAEERKKSLEMVANGTINAEEAARLMRALEEAAGEEVGVIEAPADPGPAAEPGVPSAAPELDEVRRHAAFFSFLPLAGGVLITVLSAWGMYAAQQKAGLNFWFFCLSLPLLLGVMLIALGAGVRGSRWLYVHVDRSHQQEWPRNIRLAFPLPLGLAAWFLKTFGAQIRGLDATSLDEIIQGLAAAKDIHEPLIVNVDEGADGEKVRVFIG